MTLTFAELIQHYQKIQAALNARYPVPDKEKQVFARLVKVMEEQGELSELILAKAKLQRDTKNLSDLDQSLAEEWADVFGTMILLGLDLNLDLLSAMEQKIAKIQKRLEIPQEVS